MERLSHAASLPSASGVNDPSVGPTCVDISLNLPPQPESGVATPPKKPWPPSGDRRVSVSFAASSQSESSRGSLWAGPELAWLLACMCVNHTGPAVKSRVLILSGFGVVEELFVLEDVTGW